MDKRTPGGHEYSWYVEDGADLTGRAFVVLLISGAYSGIQWTVMAAADSQEQAEAWIDANPLPASNAKQFYPDGYEMQVGERLSQRPA